MSIIIEALKWILAFVLAPALPIIGNPIIAIVLIACGIWFMCSDDASRVRNGVLMLLGGLLCAGLIGWQVHKYISDRTWCGQNYQPGQEFANCMEGLGHEPPTEAQ